jgi:hypothetical protein
MKKDKLDFKYKAQAIMAITIAVLVLAYLQLLISSRLREKEQEYRTDSLLFELDKYQQADRYDVGYADGLAHRKRMRTEAEKELVKLNKEFDRQ